MPSYPGKGHGYPYFKVQAWDQKTLAWKDYRKEAFDNEASARTFQADIDSKIKTRIVRWDADGAIPLQAPE